ncbi:MAG TPA: TonB-dependent receptor [Sphingomicrobium sp.]|nr:TonB-dependent receptor [Sphingomicrobium sp.]
MGAIFQLRGAVYALALSWQGAATAQSVAPESQDPATAAAKPSEQAPIIVTGSRIPRHNLTAVSPLTIVTGQEYKLEGAVLTEDIINQLPQVTPDQGAFISAGAKGTSTVNLRDLGASRTLVLVNGRRLLPGDPTYPAGDINIIPSSLIQRVEVLTGGASSVYGSDAVSGVVNFILDTKLDGLRIDAQSSFYQHDNRNSGIRPLLVDAGDPFPTGNTVNGANRDINAAFGTGFLSGRGRVTVYGGYRKLFPITQDERDYSACNISAESDQRFCGGSNVSAVGTFRNFYDVFHLGPDQTFLPGPSFFNFAPDNYFQRPGRRYTAGGFANLELSDALRPYLEVMYMDDRSVAQVALSGLFPGDTSRINCDNPLLSAQQRNDICFDGNFVGQTPIFDDEGNPVGFTGEPIQFTDPVTGSTYYKGVLRIGRRNVEGGPRQDDRRHRDLRLVGGVTGELGHGVTYDASYVASSVKFSDAYSNDVSITRIRRALDVVADPTTGQAVCRSALTGDDPSCVPWNIFVLGGVTPEAAAYISLPASQAATIRQRVANANATIDLQHWGIVSPWADEGPSLNVGAEYRRDSLDFRPDAAFQSGDLEGVGQPVIPFTGSTTVKEMFGEGRVPLLSHRFIEGLALEGGYRQSWHSDGTSKFSTNSYKLALDLTAVRGLRLRASLQHAVRAPNIQELFAPVIPEGFDHDPCAGVAPDATQEQCARTGVSAAEYGQILAFPFGEEAGGYNSITGGNRTLGPETARTRAIGLVLEPRFLPGLNATVDWFDINIKRAIEVVGSDAIMQTCIATGDPLFCNRIHRDPDGSLWETPAGFIDDTNANIGARHVRGIDVSANYTADLGRFGSANLEILGSRLIKAVQDDGGLSTPFDCAGVYGYPCDYPQPRWRHTARATWQLGGGPAISIGWRHVGKARLAALNPDFGLLDAVSPLEKQISAQDYFDVTALFRVMRNYVFRVGVRNVFDRAPPIVTSLNPACFSPIGGCNGNTFPQLYDPLGRYVFASVTVNLKPHF